MKLWDSYLETVSDKNNLSDYKTYYSATMRWTKKHMYCFTPEIIADNNLDFLLNLDIDEYITESPDIQLETEYKRLKNLNPGDNKIFLSCDVCGYCTAEKNIHIMFPASMKQI